MRRAALLTTTVLFVTGASVSGKGPEAGPYRVTGIRAQLFNSDRGTLSPDVLTGDVALWNVIIGEGEHGPSHATLVVVEVTGEAGAYEERRSVELTARRGAQVVLRRAAELGVLNDRGRTYAGFWLYDTGCEPIRLTAALRGQAQPSTVSAAIPFECGE